MRINEVPLSLLQPKNWNSYKEISPKSEGLFQIMLAEMASYGKQKAVKA